MPDSLKGIGQNINLPLQTKNLMRFNEAQEGGKSVNNRSTLDVTRREAAAQAEREKAATDFEALLLQQMVQSMWKAVPSEGLLSGSNEESMYRDMLSEQFSHELAKSQSLGLKEAVLGEMTKKEKR